MSRNWIEIRRVFFVLFFSQATISNQKKLVFLLQLYVFELIFFFCYTISFFLCEFTDSFLIHLQLVFFEICTFFLVNCPFFLINVSFLQQTF